MIALMPGGSDSTATVIRISPMAHIASAFVLLWLVLLMPAFGRWGLPLLAIPVLLSVAIVRLRTVADDDGVTAHRTAPGKAGPESDAQTHVACHRTERWLIARR
jgi:hypothetical protein